MTVDVYVSEWGSFPIPPDLAEKTKWRYVKAEFLQGELAVKEPDPCFDNNEFLSWLHEMEVKAGKQP